MNSIISSNGPDPNEGKQSLCINRLHSTTFSAAAAADDQVSFKRLHKETNEPTLTLALNMLLWHPLTDERQGNGYTDTTSQAR